MKLLSAIERVMLEKPNAFSESQLVVFINECEAMVQEFLGVDFEERIEYDWSYDKEEDLIAPSPYDAIYISFLKAKIDYVNEEYESYANNQAMHEDDMEKFKAWAIREDKPQNKTTARITNWW